MGNKIGIIYFSGTGNTKFVAQNIAKKLQQWGEELCRFARRSIGKLSD